MTLFAARAKDAGEPGGDRDITVGATYGPVTFKITENAGHLRSFWHQLGELLNQVEHPPVEAVSLPGDSTGVQEAYENLGREDDDGQTYA